jgi:hypothetical protein
LKAEVSKVDCSSKAKGLNVRGVDTLLIPAQNLGFFSQTNLKNLACNLPEMSIAKSTRFCYHMELFEISFGIRVKFLFFVSMLKYEEKKKFCSTLLSSRPRIQYGQQGKDEGCQVSYNSRVSHTCSQLHAKTMI